MCGVVKRVERASSLYGTLFDAQSLKGADVSFFLSLEFAPLE